MAGSTSFLELGFIRLDRRKKDSLVQQLYEAIRNAILSGQLSKGHRLPSTRSFATDLGVSRMTVVNAFDQLTVEGYLKGSVGRGTYVSEHLPEERQMVKFRPRDGFMPAVDAAVTEGLATIECVEARFYRST